ncbi:response regulator [Polynucleobacter sp. MWH-UH23A]|uniref:response regulator transcription factor n=1 Tax=Polynucleobacter sp. MWH-UH23A TaxID=1855613 RepID=UPI003364B9DC
MMNAKVIIVDDEPIVRAGLENWLSRNYKIIAFDSAQSFLEAYKQFEFEDGVPTCILLDFQMPGMNGVELQKNLKSMNAQFPIVFMSGNAQQSDIIDAWRGGAVDFILKPFTPDQVRDVLEKQFNTLSQSISKQTFSDTREHIHIPITKREAEVLLLLGSGQQQSEVAQVLGISQRTVKMYRANLRDKLELNTLGELIKYCQQYESAITKLAKDIN